MAYHRPKKVCLVSATATHLTADRSVSPLCRAAAAHSLACTYPRQASPVAATIQRLAIFVARIADQRRGLVVQVRAAGRAAICLSRLASSRIAEWPFDMPESC